MELFGRRRSDRPALKQVREWAIDLLRLAPEDSVSVTELSCAEPDCPPHETVVLIARAGEPTLQVKLAKPAGEVRRTDLLAAIDSQGTR